MTTTVHQQERDELPDIASRETLVRFAVVEARSAALAPAPRPAQASSPNWDCLVHVPGASLASWAAETLRFGGRRRRHEAAKLAYDGMWAGHGVGERGNEPF